MPSRLGPARRLLVAASGLVATVLVIALVCGDEGLLGRLAIGITLEVIRAVIDHVLRKDDRPTGGSE